MSAPSIIIESAEILPEDHGNVWGVPRRSMLGRAYRGTLRLYMNEEGRVRLLALLEREFGYDGPRPEPACALPPGPLEGELIDDED